MKKRNVAVVIPAHNEEKVIASTLHSVIKIVPSRDVYVIDDGSKDKTTKISRKFIKHVIKINNRGKAYALNFGIKHYKLTRKYDFIFFIDADTKPDPSFLEKAMFRFEKDKRKKTVCVIGQVKSTGNNWISKYRQWEYFVSHYIHKKAQENLRSILVAPGCSTVYRSKIFNKLAFPEGTLTEDMDFTFLLHRHGFDKMIFEAKAIVRTQDPQTLPDFMKQIKRWYTGFWQVVRKHNVPWQGQILDIEVSMLALEGLYNGLIVIFFILSIIPLVVSRHLNIYVIPLSIDLIGVFMPSLIISSIIDKDYTRILFAPAFYLLRFLSSITFIISFFSGYLSTEKTYSWDSNRYQQKGAY